MHLFQVFESFSLNLLGQANRLISAAAVGAVSIQIVESD